MRKWYRDPVTRQRVIIISQLSFRLALVLATMGMLWFFLVYFPGQTEYNRTLGWPDISESEGGDVYEIKDVTRKDAVIIIDVSDVIDGTITPITPEALARYASNINIKTDREGDPGFNLQDIVGVDRAPRSEDWNSHPGHLEPTLSENNTTVRAIYDYNNRALVQRREWLMSFDRYAHVYERQQKS